MRESSDAFLLTKEFPLTLKHTTLVQFFKNPDDVTTQNELLTAWSLPLESNALRSVMDTKITMANVAPLHLCNNNFFLI